MKMIKKSMMTAISAVALSSVMSMAFAADYSKTVNLTASAEFMAHVDDFSTADGVPFSILNTSDLTVPDQVAGLDPTWSIWTNAAVPVDVTFDIPGANKDSSGAYMLHDSGTTGPNGEHKVRFYLVYQECGASPDNYTVGGPSAEYDFGTPFQLSSDAANKTVCEGSNPGRLLVTNDAMNYRPFLGNYVVPLTVLVAEPA